VHFEATAKDGNKIRDFYGKVFGWSFNVMPEMDYGIVDNGGRGINGGIGGAGEEGFSGAPFYVAVPDIDATLAKAESMGAKTTAPKMVIPNIVTLAQFADADGNLIGLVEDDGTQQMPPSTAKPAENPVTWFEITGKDAKKTQDFYAKLFDWKYDMMDQYATIAGDERSSGGGISGSDGQEPHAIWYVEVADPAAKLKEIEAAGGKTVVPATDIGVVTFGVFTDPAGSKVGVYKSNQG
jgi:predicted enzyme related to lactoylglutathione lyase